MQIYYFFFIHANLSPIFSKKSYKVPFLTRIFPFKRLCLPAFVAYNKNNAPTAKHSQESGRRSFFWWSRFFLFHISKSSTRYQICSKSNSRENNMMVYPLFSFSLCERCGLSSGGCYPRRDAASEYGLNVARCDYSALPSLPSTSLILWI